MGTKKKDAGYHAAVTGARGDTKDIDLYLPAFTACVCG